VTVYPTRFTGDRWRAVWDGNDRRRQCESVTEDGPAGAGYRAADRGRAESGAAGVGPGRVLPVPGPAPGERAVVAQARPYPAAAVRAVRRAGDRGVACQDIKVAHMQEIVSAPATPGEGDRVRGVTSALVAAGIAGGYLLSPRLREVHWQAAGRPLPAPRVTAAGGRGCSSAEMPSGADVACLGQALGAGRHGDRDELMAQAAAYSGLRWGELAALTIPQADPATRVITVDRKVIEVAGHLFTEAPKNRKWRRTIYPRVTPAGYPLAERLAARLEEAAAEQAAGANPAGLVFPSSTGCPP
jgi:hypothetical protein